MSHEHTIRELIHAVRRRWLTLRALRAIVNASLSAAVVLGIALTATMWTHGAPRVLAAVAISAVVLTMAAVVRGLWPLRAIPEDRQVARFIEERTPMLEDRLVSAVDVARSTHKASLVDLMLADAAGRVRDIEPGRIVSAESLRRAGFQAAASVLVLLAVLAGGRRS